MFVYFMDDDFNAFLFCTFISIEYLISGNIFFCWFNGIGDIVLWFYAFSYYFCYFVNNFLNSLLFLLEDETSVFSLRYLYFLKLVLLFVLKAISLIITIFLKELGQSNLFNYFVRPTRFHSLLIESSNLVLTYYTIDLAFWWALISIILNLS